MDETAKIKFELESVTKALAERDAQCKRMAEAWTTLRTKYDDLRASKEMVDQYLVSLDSAINVAGGALFVAGQQLGMYERQAKEHHEDMRIMMQVHEDELSKLAQKAIDVKNQCKLEGKIAEQLAKKWTIEEMAEWVETHPLSKVNNYLAVACKQLAKEMREQHEIKEAKPAEVLHL